MDKVPHLGDIVHLSATNSIHDSHRGKVIQENNGKFLVEFPDYLGRLWMARHLRTCSQGPNPLYEDHRTGKVWSLLLCLSPGDDIPECDEVEYHAKVTSEESTPWNVGGWEGGDDE